ncbi:MAG: AMP-binding protein, partial [Deltaproteobacteria bacterium]|nr:AMP-binding protein [Deltaproteobacteria bacterium]
ALGVHPGSRVALRLGNSPAFLLAWLGAVTARAIAVPINPQLTLDETRAILAHAEPSALVVEPDWVEEARKLTAALPGLRVVLVAGGDAAREGPGLLPFQALLEAPPLPLSRPGPEDVATFIYTSGTTGRSKAVMQTHQTYVLTGQAFPWWLGLTAEDRLLTALPLFHINAQAYSTMGTIGAGATLVLLPRFSASRFWEQAAASRATEFNALGAMLAILLKQPPTAAERAHAVRICYTAPVLPAAMHEACEARFGFHLKYGYGLSESTFGPVVPRGRPWKPGGMGRARQHPELGVINEVRVVDPAGNELPPGVVGEIVLRNPAVMKGYFKEPALTAEALRGGWFHTGDSACRDTDGDFFFVDRLKDLIRRRGENISSVEIEDVLRAHPAVLECAAIPVPSELTEDEIKAYVVFREGAGAEAAELFAWCAARLARFKVPRFLEVREALPHTPTGRVAKYQLRQEAATPKGPRYDREALPVPPPG